MSLIDVAIPGVIGLVLLVWPEAVFIGSRVTPDAKKIRMLRGVGVILLVVAVIYAVVARFGG